MHTCYLSTPILITGIARRSFHHWRQRSQQDLHSWFGTLWKTKSWMPGRYNTYKVSPTLGAPTPATSHCYYPIPFVHRELSFVLVFVCAAKTKHTLWGSKSASWCPNFPTHWTIPWTPDFPTHGTTLWIPYYPTHGITYWTPPFSTHRTPNACTHSNCWCHQFE